MPNRRAMILLSLTLLGGVPARAQETPSTGPAPLPTAAEVRKEVDGAQYRDALKNILRILDLKGQPAAVYDRTEMLLLRGECQLQIRQIQAAQEALDAAVKEARGVNGVPPNPENAGKALALSALITKSPSMMYTPKTRTGPLAPKPINILDRTARPAAYKALFVDALADVETKVRALQLVQTMPPILDAAKSVAALRALEKAGTGDDAQSKVLAGDLTNHAAALLASSMGGMTSAADAIGAGANLVYTLPIQRVDMVTGARYIDQAPRRRGLVNDDGARLKSIQQTTAQIITACQDLDLLLDARDTFKSLAADANTLTQKAGKILSDDYSRMPQ